MYKKDILYSTAEEALLAVESGNRVFIHGGAATPVYLVNKLFERANELRNIELVAISTYGDIQWNRHEVLKSFYLNSLFVSANVRDWVNGDRGDYVPVFLNEIPRLFEDNILPLDVALIQVSIPDDDGYCTLGTSVDIAYSATKHAKCIIAQVNPMMSKVLGEPALHVSMFNSLVWHEEPLIEVCYGADNSDVIKKIGQYVSELVEDGSTLQLGIGNIPDAALAALTNHKDLGIHSEMVSDGILPLIEQGVITNKYKTLYTGKSVCSFILGSKKIYDYADNNPNILCRNVSYVNDPYIISQNPKVVAINSAIEIDLTGQICADSIGTKQYSGIGGQMDFMRGASASKGGKPIIAMPSTTKSGASRIVPYLKQGAGVVTTRGNVHYVITEYGVVNLFGKNMDQRAALLISIAHPDHREVLERAYFERFRTSLKIH